MSILATYSSLLVAASRSPRGCESTDAYTCTSAGTCAATATRALVCTRVIKAAPASRIIETRGKLEGADKPKSHYSSLVDSQASLNNFAREFADSQLESRDFK
jgi:hypothetical protein